MGQIVDYDAGIRLQLDPPKAYIVLNRPEQMNSLTDGMLQAVTEALVRIDEADDVKVVIVKGNGRAFSVGADLQGIPAKEGDAPWFGAQSDDLHNMLRFTRSGSASRAPAGGWTQLWYFRKPTIAQVHGYCYAAGTQPAMNCDLVIAASDALIGQPQVRAQGFVPDFTMWPLTVNPRKLKRIMFTGDPLSGEEAEEIGMITKAVPPDELEEYVEWLADRIAAMPMEMLEYGKLALNGCYDILGLPSMMSLAAIYDTFAHFAPSSESFGGVARSEGVRAALESRDGAFGGPHRLGDELPRGPDDGGDYTL